jgi:hypothetical protein
MDILVKCPCYHSGPGSEAAQKGSDQHAYAEALILDDKSKIEETKAKVESADRANVEWYVDLIHAQASGQLEIEQSLELMDANFECITFGTIDAAAGPEIWDYKSDREERDHKYQMAAYSLMRIRQKALPQVTAHICYGKLRKVVSRTYTESEAWNMIEEVMARYYDPNKAPMPCEYCGWCREILTCSAMTRHLALVAKNTAVEEQDKIVSWEPSAITDPTVASRMLSIARIVGPWCESVEKHVKLLIEHGAKVPGWSIMERAGARQVTDITKAFSLCGLSEDAFLTACSVTMGKLEEVYAAEKGVKKAQAKRDINQLLESVIETKRPQVLLVKEKGE